MAPSPDPLVAARDLLGFIDAAPSPYHAVAEAARRLDAAGFTAVDPADPWPSGAAAGRGYLVRDGALVGWARPADAAPASPFRLVGAHTDSPNLRIRPQPDVSSAGWRQLGVEPYGGVLLNSWLDRDLGLAGRVALRGSEGPGIELRTLRVDEPILRVPQLAIHLDRDISTNGLLLNRQQHLTPVWGVGQSEPGGFAGYLAERLDVDTARIAAWDLMAFDVTPGALVGVDQELLSTARLDNLCSCWAGITALAGSGAADGNPDSPTAVVSLFDHEEVGSTSATGADSTLLGTTLERLVLASDGTRADLLRALAGSMCVSADMAHATHPNYPERHEPRHQVAVNAGPVVKLNVNQRYATDARTQAAFETCCADVGIPVQRFSSRGDVPCGSTIGPTTAARLGIPTVDVGVAQLAMHSARELCGSADPARFGGALAAWLG